MISAAHAATATVQAVVSATPVPTVVPSPSVSPVAHAAAQVATSQPDALSSLWNWANAIAVTVPATDAIAAGAILAVSIQALLNRLPWLNHEVAWVENVRRQLVAVVIPFATALLASLATGHNDLHLAPVLFLASQVLFWTGKALLKGYTKGTAQVVTTTLTEPEIVGQG